ncbi:MAG: hypothetical protein HYU62_09705 [Caulobacterales bacterium]|nr:hypothetical protein [Caulobacterales bacterium]
MSDTHGSVTKSQIYEQRCAEFRSLNGFFWQIPLIVMTLNGGLWFAVASLDVTPVAKSAILCFAGIANLAMIVALVRLRGIMETLLAQIRIAEETPSGRWGWVVLTVFCGLFGIAALGAFAAAGQPEVFFGAKTPSAAAPVAWFCPAPPSTAATTRAVASPGGAP